MAVLEKTIYFKNIFIYIINDMYHRYLYLHYHKNRIIPKNVNNVPVRHIYIYI